MTAARQFHTQQTHYVTAELEFSDFSTSAPTKTIGVIPKGSIIISWSAMLRTAFTASSLSLPLFVVGDVEKALDSQRFLATTGIGFATVGYYTGTTGAGFASTDLTITAQLLKGAMAALPTTGKLVYALQYIPPNDNKNLNSTFD